MLTDLYSTAVAWASDAVGLTIKASLILAVAILTLRLLPRLASSVRFLVLFYALTATMMLPVLALALPQWNVVPTWLQSTATRLTPSSLEAAPTALQTDGAVRRDAVIDNGPAQSSQPDNIIDGLHFSIAPGAAVFALWLLGMLFLSARTAVAMRRLGRMRRQSVCLESARWRALLAQAAGTLNVGRLPRLRFHPEPVMPATVGLLRPAIVLPVEAEDWTAQRKRDVLLHELAHLKRNDLAYEWLSLAACLLQWFNPLVWWVQRKMIIERERACDDMVLNAGADPATYADCLLKTAVQFRPLPAPCPGMARRSDLETRLVAVLDASQPRARVTLPVEISVLVAAVSFAIPVATLALNDDPAAQPTATQSSVQGTALLRDEDRAAVARLKDALTSKDAFIRRAARQEIESLGRGHPVVVVLSVQLFGEYYSDSDLFRDYSIVDGNGNPDRLLAQLESAFAVERAAAAKRLGEFREPRVLQGLLRSLRDEDWHVREWSARSLGRIGYADGVDDLVNSLSDPHPAVREWSARALGDIGDPAAVPGLSQTLADTDGEVREWAARSLGRIGDPGALDGLVASLQDSDDNVREWALRALGDIGDRRAIDAMEALVNDANPDIREWSTRALEKIRAAEQGER